jgi:hypothetical protein
VELGWELKKDEKSEGNSYKDLTHDTLVEVERVLLKVYSIFLPNSIIDHQQPGSIKHYIFSLTPS